MSGEPVERKKEQTKDSAIGRREFLKKGAAAGLLPYVAPVITTFLLDVDEAGARGAAVSPAQKARHARAARAARAAAAFAKKGEKA